MRIIPTGNDNALAQRLKSIKANTPQVSTPTEVKAGNDNAEDTNRAEKVRQEPQQETYKEKKKKNRETPKEEAAAEV